jgi:hypothetical protein
VSDSDVTDFQERLRAKEAADAAYFEHLDRKSAAVGIIAKAIEHMRDVGLSTEDIAQSRSHAVDVLEGKDN